MIWTALVACLPGTYTPDEQLRIEGLRFDADALPAPSDDRADDPEVVALGKALYFDRAFATDRTTSCATCHALCRGCDDPTAGSSGADPRMTPTSAGAAGVTPRAAPTVLESAHRGRWGWYGRFCALDDQSTFPFSSHAVYGLETDTWKGVVARGVRYRYAADWPFGDVPVDDDDVVEQVGVALEGWLRSLPPSTTPLDRLLDGDDEALDPVEQEGLRLFVGKAHCVDCHDGPLLSDDQPHNVGVASDDLGRGDDDIAVCVRPDDPPRADGTFVTPPLRNVALTAPYMHDGSLATLEDVVWHYDVGGAPEGTVGEVDGRLKPLGLSDEERQALVAFLRTLGPS
ncbi:MAG: c-type cytochrome [Alphaproteobacteria bacterium]|nr:c-type cytochrome [Alphaproteobacteria bacterium]